MNKQMKFKFDHNQSHQVIPVESTVKLFEGLSENDLEIDIFGEEDHSIIPNIPHDEELDEDWLFNNFLNIQSENREKGVHFGAHELPISLDVDEGLPLEGAGFKPARYPVFTIEMETGTGKTYTYLRTIFELFKQYSFRKYIIVVPSVAIYEGTVKSFSILEEPLRTHCGVTTRVTLTNYSGTTPQKIKHFAESNSIEVMIMTIDSFNTYNNSRSDNNIYKPTEKLPGEMLPYEYVAKTRPIFILDESHNYSSDKAKEALRTLNPLFALYYSATPTEKPNMLYRLRSIDAFKANLVKRIEVIGLDEMFTEQDDHKPLIVDEIKKNGRDIVAIMKLANKKGSSYQLDTFVIKQGAHLDKKTHNEYYDGYEVDNIDLKNQVVEFTNGITISTKNNLAAYSKEEIFKAQIEETIKEHFKKQAKLKKDGVKVLTLFFIDRVANYRDEQGLIKTIFEETFERLKVKDPHFKQYDVAEVHQGYFATKKKKDGSEEAVDTSGSTKAEKELEKDAFKLIMQRKEALLSFDEPVSFIFAHSALKEGWDNPNVFQICTLNQTKSERKKRQEIGRGMRLCVNQDGERLEDEDLNVLTVIANDDYDSYCALLQSDYEESGDVAPPKPTRAFRSKAIRNSKVYSSNEFEQFWNKLIKETKYEIRIDEPTLIKASIERLNKTKFPSRQIVMTRGEFLITSIKLSLKKLLQNGEIAVIEIEVSNTRGSSNIFERKLKKGANLARMLDLKLLKGFKIVEIVDGDEPIVKFGNGVALSKYASYEFDTQEGVTPEIERIDRKEEQSTIGDILGRIAKETTLTRPVILEILKSMKEEQFDHIFSNPEGFISETIDSLQEVMANHIADKIHYTTTGKSLDFSIDELFPEEASHPQKELIDGSDASLYDKVQIDSDVEERFILHRLNSDDNVIMYFKFPSKFRMKLPKIIGNYNPDWAIIRWNDSTKQLKLELVRETKGQIDIDKLRFSNESRKIKCARRYFEATGINYDVTTDKELEWWKEKSVLDL